jgi:hypothetical protein
MRGGFRENVASRPRVRMEGVSGLPETDIARVRRWCRGRVPERVRDKVRIEVDIADGHLTIVECRPPWSAELGLEWTRSPIAQMRYSKSPRLWSLFWRDRDSLFLLCDQVPPTANIDDLLAEVDSDPTGIFWG